MTAIDFAEKLPPPIAYRYIKNVKNSRWGYDIKKNRYDQYPIENFIFDAFSWESSPEGYEYWQRIYNIICEGGLDDTDRIR